MRSPMYQVSTLQALAKGYFYGVKTVGDLLDRGDTGLGTFVGVDGEMIILDGHCYRADEKGEVKEVTKDAKTPFAVVSTLVKEISFTLAGPLSMADVLSRLNEEKEKAGRNQIFLARIDGEFEEVYARSEIGGAEPYSTLAELLKTNQKEFHFGAVKGSLVCVYFPPYMDGLNLADWHIHFLSEDHSQGGHVFAFTLKQGEAAMAPAGGFQLEIPSDAHFQTMDLKNVSKKEIESVEKAGE